MPTFDTPEPITADIEVSAGSVRLIASERSDTVVDVRPLDESSLADVKAGEGARVDFTNGRLRVSALRRGLSWGRGAVAVVVELPSRSVVRGQFASATLRTQGHLGDCRVQSASGDVDLDRTAALTVTAASADVIVAGATGNVKLSTASGAITLRSADGAVTVKTGSGRTEVGDLTGGLTFGSASGSVSVGTVRGRLKGSTASGDITVGAAVQGTLVLSTASGDVQIGIPEGTSAHLDLKTASGSVCNRLEFSDGPGADDDTVSVRAHTASGDITVQRPIGAGAL